ncbi:hypothetical protein MUP01_09420 [Candidatus Bathyarchaeota archaeon]|nr:hypothetical protein [Candidatus Bathyarchaeota archaeon]
MPKQDSAQTRTDEYRVITLFVLAAVSVYIGDAAIDAFIFHDGPFLDVLMILSPGELSVRLYISASFVVFGIAVSKILANRRKTEHALQLVNLQVQEYANQLEEKVEDRTRELVEAQKRLLKSERFAAIGELAGMVGHDLRNPLTGIAGATYYIRKHCVQDMDCKTREMLETIEGDIGRSNKIINDLLEYSREIRLELTESNPRSMIKEALSTIKIPNSVRTVNLTENKPKAKVDTEKIKRVFINIIRNALDAMPPRWHPNNKESSDRRQLGNQLRRHRKRHPKRSIRKALDASLHN